MNEIKILITKCKMVLIQAKCLGTCYGNVEYRYMISNLEYI